MSDSLPLAALLRPECLGQIVGQAHLIDVGKPLRVMIERKVFFSMILWGPPGSGKTTLARVMAKELGAKWVELSAVSAGKADVKTVVDEAVKRPGEKTILFLDEIHRFTKAQQDFLLPFVENGSIMLIGATTENPSFSVISPLLSRCRVFVLQALSDEEMKLVLQRGEAALQTSLQENARDWIIQFAEGDARQLFGLLEQAVALNPEKAVQSRSDALSVEDIQNATQTKYIRYDKKGEEHYNVISAFIKSMRASQPNSALYYLARMIEAGEDPLFIARRMVIFASEDIGNAQPTALVVTNAVFQACQTIGYPECQLQLTQGVLYLSQAKKNRTVPDALARARADVRQYGSLPIPLTLRNAPTQFMKDQGYGKDYQHYSQESYLPEKIKNAHYLPSEPEKN